MVAVAADAAVEEETGTGTDAEAPVDAAPPRVDKLDVLFVVDNSFGMASKQRAVAGGIARFFGQIAATDIHVGVISSTIDQGGDICDRSRGNNGDSGRLLNRTHFGADAGPSVHGAEAGFLSLGPGGSVPDMATLEERAKELVLGADEYGCGIESPLEAMYRFVAQPDPPLRFTIDSAARAEPTGVDYALLAERRAFFRPDSAVVILIVSDEDDASIDPRALGGLGYGFASLRFPYSQVSRPVAALGTTAPRGTSACATDPFSADCRSCIRARDCDPSEPACAAVRADAECKTSPVDGQSGEGFDGFVAPDDDHLNLRGFDMKRRFGVEARYPIERYVAALTRRQVPNRASEHPRPSMAAAPAPYEQATNCDNPLFSTGLPAKEGDELCALPPGPRDPRRVVLGILAGAPPGLVSPAPDWTKLLGQGGFESDDTTGLDPHMLPSSLPRAGLGGADLPLGDNGTDPVHGREWTTRNTDLQFACTFALPVPEDCMRVACICGGRPEDNFPLCSGPGNTTQVRAKAYPGIRLLRFARQLGEQGAVGSVCGADTEGSYGAFLEALGRRVAGRLAE
ncbi:MAG: hypothetical protein KIT84_23040 [Labilithrix sp.]|nr:hypothetical protein [Labilithrix sp.]MCW5813922.1 hypothetical protein [Labilithrix sp.]